MRTSAAHARAASAPTKKPASLRAFVRLRALPGRQTVWFGGADPRREGNAMGD
jgi:hypothetical protein